MSASRHPDRRLHIFERDGYRCVYCGRVLDIEHLTLDHVQPRVQRGDQSPGNLVTSCVTCNTRKGDRPAWDWLSDRPADRANFLRYAIHVWPRLRRAVEEAARPG